MDYQIIQPCDQLRPFVKHFGILKGNYIQPAIFKIIADGTPGLIFQSNNKSFLHLGSNTLPNLFLHGVTTTHSEKICGGNFCNIGVYFRPGALKVFFGIDADELTDKYIDFELIRGTKLTELLVDSKTDQNRVKILSDFLLGELKKSAIKQNVYLKQLLFQINTNPHLTLPALRAGFNVSERSFERNIKQSAGISAKLLLRIHRFQAALKNIRVGNYNNLTDLAYTHLYADQSHFIHDFKEFSGLTPKQFVSATIEQAENFPQYIK